MSKDIRSFFAVVSKKTVSNDTKSTQIKPKKKPRAIVDSDEEITETPDKTKLISSTNKRKKQVISSDSEDESKGKTKSPPKMQKNKNTESTSNLKPVNIDDVFGNTVIKQSKVELPPETTKIEKTTNENGTKKGKKRQKIKTEIGVHGNEDFEKTLLELDDDVLLENVDILDKTIEEAMQNKEKKESHVKKGVRDSKENSSNKSNKKRQRKDSTEGVIGKKPKLDHTDSGIDPDQEAFEKKRYSAMLYQKYKNRGGPKHHGEKELPKGET
ncbi:hypothetical protein NQ318_008973 [Aromia moschata]|uniref:Uncharacterized protein n=1 Tax=Aromia moschata TaxID=1265417 RepID=A0AAV8ZCL0_9CUCU|nr:hypothetical protein NQ318_008973 [Aromia moschata]